MRFGEERGAVRETARRMYDAGLVAGTSGNVSLRLDSGDVAITPHGATYASMRPEDVLVLSPTGEVIEGSGQPSVEAAIHLEVLGARRDVGSVVHSHPVHASMFAVARRPIPAVVDEFCVDVGAEVPVARYAISGTPELAANVLAALGPFGRAALMANHGLVVAAESLAQALELSAAVERNAQVLLGATALGGAVALPPEATSLYTQVFEYRARQALGED